MTGSGPRGGRTRLFGQVAIASLVALLAAWLATALGYSWTPLSRLVVVLAVGTTAAWLLLGARSLWRSGTDGRWLLVLLVLALAVRWVGIDHEVAERYYLDEGTYHHHASEINAGEVLRGRFVYPHFLYYLDAVLLWILALFRPLADGLAARLYGLGDPLAVDWLVLRGAVAWLSAATVWPVYRLGTLISGRWAAVLGALLLIFSPPFNEGSHLMISDVPSAVFATFALWLAVRAGIDDRRRDYLAAGVFAGLAAATKYPAGIVAVAIIASWLGARWLSRKWSWDLLWAGLVSLTTFVVVMPSLLVYTENAFFGGQGIFFGVRQYAGGGWIGVLPRSNLGYYLELLVDSLGWPAVLVALGGLTMALAGRRWRDLGRLAWLVPFPFVYLALIVSMTVVVKRNLFPALPAFCVLTAALQAFLVAPLAARFSARWSRQWRWASRSAALVVLLLPVWNTALQSIALARPGTRVIARQRIEATLPTGSYIVKESYTPDLPHERFWVHQSRFVPRLGLERLESPEVDFILVSSNASRRFFVAETFKPHHEQYRATYEHLFDRHALLWQLAPSPILDGPYLELYLGGPLRPQLSRRLAFEATEAYTPSEEMVREGEVVFGRADQWAAFKGYLAAGTYRLSVEGRNLAGGRLFAECLAAVDREGRAVPVSPGSPLVDLGLGDKGERLDLTLSEPAKLLLRVELRAGGALSRLSVDPLPSAAHGDGRAARAGGR